MFWSSGGGNAGPEGPLGGLKVRQETSLIGGRVGARMLVLSSSGILRRDGSADPDTATLLASFDLVYDNLVGKLVNWLDFIILWRRINFLHF
jgi:hypothetical protein